MRSIAQRRRFRFPALLARRIGWPVVVCLILALTLLTVNPAPAAPQAGFVPGGQPGLTPGTLFPGQPELFANDGRIRLLVLKLNPFGLTETAVEQYGEILQDNLINTEHFDVVGPRQVEEIIERLPRDLVDCRGIACGVKLGKLLGAEFVVVGNLRQAEPLIVLGVRIIDTSNNLTDYEEEIRFPDETMDEDLFRLANNISRNSLLKGRVLSTSIRGIVISLGRVHGIRLGDHLVIYKQEVPITNLEGQQVDTQRKNVAIVKVLNVNRNSAEAILIHKTEEPQVGHFVHTYRDTLRQIELVENTRKELDTGIRLANRIRPLELAPVLISDTERQAWLDSLREAEKERTFWFTVGLIAGGVTLFVLNDFENETSDRIQLAVAGGATGYAFWKWNRARQSINDIIVEGRSKGYVHLDLTPFVTPRQVGLQLAFRF